MSVFGCSAEEELLSRLATHARHLHICHRMNVMLRQTLSSCPAHARELADVQTLHKAEGDWHEAQTRHRTYVLAGMDGLH